MNHMSDQRAFVQERSSDARALNRRRSGAVEPIISMLAVPGEIGSLDDKQCDQREEGPEDFVSFAWSYYGTSTYAQRFSVATDGSEELDDEDSRRRDVPQILISTH
jgi:hypothetical protein